VNRKYHHTLLPMVLAALPACSSQEARPASTQAAPAQSSDETTADNAGTAAASVANSPAAAKTTATIGQPAPDFALPALGGGTVRLSEHRGKVVVLEWFNPDCPFVRQAHARKEQLQGLAERHQKDGVVWLAINSGAPGKQGHGVKANQQGKQRHAMAHPILLDESGAVGRLYGAKRTPHLYVIDASGKLVYGGALDNTKGGDLEDAEPTFVNYVATALADISAGRAVATPQTEPYGCSVKYGD